MRRQRWMDGSSLAAAASAAFEQFPGKFVDGTPWDDPRAGGVRSRFSSGSHADRLRTGPGPHSAQVRIKLSADAGRIQFVIGPHPGHFRSRRSAADGLDRDSH
jgi:hypothetical protein